LRAAVIPARVRSVIRLLQLREYAYHLPHGAACGGVGVDVFREGTEFDTTVFQVIQHGYQVAQATA
jgi:hypothetical protein